MRPHEPHVLKNLASDIELELSMLAKLECSIQQTQQNLKAAPDYNEAFYESLALKFHNFYTGCERIFSLVSTELNGGVSKSADWHRRLLQRMQIEQDERKAVISSSTANALDEFLRFRHVVRNIYGFELETDRVDTLLEAYPVAWAQFETDMKGFVDWLRELAIALEA